MRVSRIRVITNAEFIQMMDRCRPPTGWPSTIAVANSAGPDSTCLLFLLRRMIHLQHQQNDINKGPPPIVVGSPDLPDSILSLHVDHGLQSDAEKMAHAARTTARTFKADHSELRIPWGDPPFPPRPGDEGGGDAVESVARTARYRLIFDAMVRHRRHDNNNDDNDSSDGVRVLATGHHADDQVETVLMRLGSGSSILGLGGMRPVRRFGMALGKRDSDFGWFGHEGLHRWIVRPLLDVSKDRILATCELHGLHYVLDRTNFQPDLTVRNAIRHVLANNEKIRHSTETLEPVTLPPVLADKITRMTTASESLKTLVPIDLMASRENLHAAVRYSSQNLFDIESQVSAYLNRCSVPAPPGTFILAADKFWTTVKDPLVQLAMVLRILRYVSPHPWGSTRAQAGRRSERLQRIAQRIWDPDPASKTRASFEGGANVLWTPLRICRDGRLKYGRPRRGERFGWLASRALPPRPCQSDFDRDISTDLSSSKRCAEVLYDNRFLITFRLEAIPPGDPVMTSITEGSGRIVLVLGVGGRWLWPQVVWRRKGEGDVTVACISAPELDWYEPAPGTRRNYSTSENPKEARPLWQDAVDFKFIRVLDEP